jgi:hypothetical protein
MESKAATRRLVRRQDEVPFNGRAERRRQRQGKPEGIIRDGKRSPLTFFRYRFCSMFFVGRQKTLNQAGRRGMYYKGADPGFSCRCVPQTRPLHCILW